MSDNLETRLTEAFNREAARLTPGFPEGPRAGGVYFQPWWLRTPVLAGAGVILAAAVVALVVVIATKPDHKGDRLQVGARPKQVQPATSTTVSSAPVTGSVPATFVTAPPTVAPTTAVPVVTPTSPVTLPTHTSAVGPVSGSPTTAAVVACTSSQLQLSEVSVANNDSNQVLTYALTNVGAPCTLDGYPTKVDLSGQNVTFTPVNSTAAATSLTVPTGNSAYGTLTAPGGCSLPVNTTSTPLIGYPATSLSLVPPGGSAAVSTNLTKTPQFLDCQSQTQTYTVNPLFLGTAASGTGNG